nr:response regulator [uncultured Cohaesibacter sp.]
MRRGKGAIVVADANANACQSIGQQFSLQDHDVVVIEATSPEALRTILAEQPVDMLLINERFSYNSGLDTLEQLGPLTQGIIIVLMADYFSRETLVQAEKANLYDCIQTPLNEEDVARLMKRRDARLTRLSALVVDSQPAARHIIFNLLSDSPFDLMISEAASGPLAVALCKSIQYHIMLVDPASREWSGAGMVKHIMDRQASCRIVLMSTQDQETLQDLYSEVDISGFLKKPFYAEDVERLVHQLLKIPLSNLLKGNFYKSQTPRPDASPSHISRKQSPDDNREIVWL